jgi:hypothetical protein
MALATPAGTPIPLAAMDTDRPGSPAAIEDLAKGGNQNPVASTNGVPLPISDRGTADSVNPGAYAAARARRGMHSVGAPAAGPRGGKLDTVGPISSK